MFLASAGIEQYLFTMGVLVSFAGMLIGIYFSRKQIISIFKEKGVDLRKLLLSFAVVLIFVSAEALIVKPTQQLFFDDTIYQDMALNLLHMGQAWMCNYGTASTCIAGSTFHEPIGTAFLLAIGFATFGLSRPTAYGTMFFVASLSVFMTFVVALLLSKKFKVAIFAEFIMALTPVMLVWAYPTTSDMPMLAFSLIAIAMMLIFLEKRSISTLFTAFMALSLLTYMKIDGVVYLIVIPLFYVIISDGSLKQSIIGNLRRIREHWLDTRFLLVVLVFALAIAPEVGFAANELVFGSFGYQGAYMQQTCLTNQPSVVASRPIDLQNFEANLCSNVDYWLNAYAGVDIIQPLAFTAFAIIGIAFMLAAGYRRQLLAIAIWFGMFFMLYTSFYAGGVLYGVDWRFMLSLAAPAAILGGYGVYGVAKTASIFLGGIFER